MAQRCGQEALSWPAEVGGQGSSRAGRGWRGPTHPREGAHSCTRAALACLLPPGPCDQEPLAPIPLTAAWPVFPEPCHLDMEPAAPCAILARVTGEGRPAEGGAACTSWGHGAKCPDWGPKTAEPILSQFWRPQPEIQVVVGAGVVLVDAGVVLVDAGVVL